jgi:hypothetical protein
LGFARTLHLLGSLVRMIRYVRDCLPRIGEYRKARYSLGCLEVLPFEMSFLEGTARSAIPDYPGPRRSVRKELIMSTTTDPPSDERKSVEGGFRAHGLGRMFVTRKTLMLAFQTVKLAVRIAELVTRWFDGF